MTEAEFADLSVKILVGGLILLMGFIMWDLAKKSGAGKFGTFIIFLVLGLCVAAFLIKEVLIVVLDK
ncbi:MAG: DUF2788 domain-containing protein [Gammaproteobacteria bacterium]